MTLTPSKDFIQSAAGAGQLVVLLREGRIDEFKKVIHEARRNSKGFRLDFSGEDLSGLDLSSIDLTGAILRGTNFTNAALRKLARADLTDAILIRADLEGADCQKAKFQGANIDGAKINGADFGKAELEGMENYARRELESAINASSHPPASLPFKAPWLTREIILEKLNMGSRGYEQLRELLKRQREEDPEYRPNLVRADVKIRDISGMDFSNADARGLRASCTNMDGVNFSGADLRHAWIFDSPMSRAVFAGADLTDAIMIRCECNDTDFSDAKTDKACLSLKNLESGTNLTSAQIAAAREAGEADPPPPADPLLAYG